MPGKTVLLVIPYDQGDILCDFIDWHLGNGFDFVLAQDGGSTDGSRDILDRYAKTSSLAWFPLPERDMAKYDMVHTMGELARDKYGADWMVFLDVDEFLCTRDRPLPAILDDAERGGASVVNLKRWNMTGTSIPDGQPATRALSLRIDRPTIRDPDTPASDELPAPFLFVNYGQPKVAVRAGAFTGFGLGMHSATTSWGSTIESEELRVLQYPIRGYEAFAQKVANTRAWFRDNPQLPEWWAWHWRRWIRLDDAGLLRSEYDQQFPSPDAAAELIRTGVCSVDDSVKRWLEARETGLLPKPPGLLQRLTSAFRYPAGTKREL